MNGINVGSPINRGHPHANNTHKINLIGCKKCEFKCTDRRYLSAHNRIEHRLQNENVEEENFIEKLIIIVKETSEHTELIMESLLEKAQGLVEELIDFKSAFPKCDNIRATVDGSESCNMSHDGGMSYASDIQMGSLSQSPNAPSLSTAQTGGSRNSQNGTPIVNGTPFIPDFGLSALTSLTQIAKLTQKDTPNSLLASNPAIPNHHHPATIGANLAQSLTNQNLASLGTLSLEAFKQCAQLKKDHSRQRAHPENAPQCHICGRICSTTWNLKQHIEKHYDIHPQKGVLKKKFEETSRNQAQNLTNQQTGFHGFGNTQESIQIENQIQLQHQQLLRQASEISTTGSHSETHSDDQSAAGISQSSTVVEINTAETESTNQNQTTVQPISAPLTSGSTEDVVDITASSIKQEKIDDPVSVSPNSTSPVIKKRKPENISSRKYDSSVRDLFSKMGTQSNSSLLTPSTLAINGPNLIRQSQISPGQIGQSTSPNSQDRSLRGDQSGGPNICPYCKKGWRTKSALEMHIRVHTGEEPFICPYCGKGHKQKGQLKVHITKHHPQVQNAFEALSLRRDSNSSSTIIDDQHGRPSKINPVLSRQTDFDCHQCGLSCHSWAKLEKHLQWHEENDHSNLHSEAESGQSGGREESGGRDSPVLGFKSKNLANLSASQYKMLKEMAEAQANAASASSDGDNKDGDKPGGGGPNQRSSRTVSRDDGRDSMTDRKSESDRMEMSGDEGKMSEGEN